MNKLSGTLVYVAVHEPKKAFQKPGTPFKPDEWSAGVVITDKKVKKEFEKYAASVDAKVSLKEVDSADFEEIYKTELPEGAGDEVWVVTLRKSTELGKTGKPVPEMFHPRVYLQTTEGNKVVRQEITHTKLVGNGSKGTISIDPFVRDNGTASLYLKNVLVTDLVEYVRQEGTYAEPGSEFDEDDDTPVETKPEKKEEPKPARKSAPTKSAPAKKAVVEDFADEDLPF